MATDNVKIGAGFKVDSITIYQNYAQVNGSFMRDLQVGGIPSNQFSFSVTVEEGKALVPGQPYDFKLVPQTTPDAAPVQPAP